MTIKTFSQILGCSMLAMLPVFAHAAGTYYVGNYQSPQQNYSQMGYAAQRQNMNYTQDMTYSRTRTRVVPNSNAYVGSQYSGYQSAAQGQAVQHPQQKVATVENKSAGKGLWLSPALAHEYANWRFDMKSAGSILHYDNVRWNVFDVTGGYRFDAGNTPLQIDAGFKYGMQFGDSTMVDDDITNGGYFITEWVDQNTNAYIGDQYGHSLSVGTSNGGNMFGFNAGLGLTDFFKMGAVRFTPSIGYRYMKYKLETKQTKGMTLDTAYCGTVNGTNEIQCDPFVSLVIGTDEDHISGETVLWQQNQYGWYTSESMVGAVGVSTGGSYMYILPDVSHSYEVSWVGPYLALDMAYDIDAKNAVTGRVEFGLPAYTSDGDQPYRADWQHPTSVKDEAGMGDAWHFGLGANYMTAITDTVSFSLGFTFDYYTVSGASAKTYLNSDYYMGIYNALLQQYLGAGLTESDMLSGANASDTAINIKNIQSECPGWVCKTDNEIESVYKSLGVRIGINAKF